MTFVSFRAIVPPTFGINIDVLQRNMKGAVDQTVNIVRDDYKKTTTMWQHKPKFQKKRTRVEAGTLVGRAFTSDRIYGYVERGTRAHPIGPKTPGGMLKFRWGGQGSYKAKTRPGVIGSSGGGQGGPWVRMKAVNHPGSTARNFTATIKKRRQRTLERLATAAFNKSLISKNQLGKA